MPEEKKNYDMPKAISVITMMVLYAILIGAVGYILTRNEPIGFQPPEEPQPAESRCMQKAKIEMTCSAVGYEFDQSQAKCVVVSGAGCIDKLPFASLGECQTACEAPSEVLSAAIGEDFLITLDANITTGYTWQANFNEHYLILRSKDFVNDRNGPKLGASGKEIFTFTPIQSGETAVTMEYSRPFESKPVDVKKFDYRILENKDASLMTSKTEYAKGETVKMTMYNISKNAIWFMEGISNCNTRPYKIYKLVSGQWSEVSGYPTICVGQAEEQIPFYTKSFPGSPVNLQWDQKLWDYPRQTYDADEGTYRIIMKYGRSSDGSGQRDLYSNEFMIKEKQPDVLVSTDKTGYIQGEKVKISVKNNLDRSIFYERQIGCGLSFWRLESNENGAWQSKEIISTCFWEMAGPLITELKSGESITNEWNLTSGDNFIGEGNYRIIFNYGLDEKYYWQQMDGGQLSEYSDEFAVKGRSEPDPKCDQKVGGFGMCKALREGYEFDHSSGKCLKRGVSGCSFEIPFETSEECQKACEKGIGETDLYSCEKDSDCVSVNADCCGCNAGGAETSINKKYQNEWSEKLNCAGIMCAMVISDDPSCFSVPACINNKCEMAISGNR